MPGFWAIRDKGNPVFDTPKRGELTYTPLHNGTAEKQAMNTNLHEIRWHGRGGQGAITAAKITAQAAYLD
ncbi:MAG: hypothetical protein WBC89_03950, partial [Dehalococcoidia bacterium]